MLILMTALMAWLVWAWTPSSQPVAARPAIQDPLPAKISAPSASNHETPPLAAANPSFPSAETPSNFLPSPPATAKVPALDAPAPAGKPALWPSNQSIAAAAPVFPPDRVSPQLTETFEVRVPDLPGQAPATIPAVLAELNVSDAPETSMAPDVAAGTAAMAEEFVSQLEAVPAQADEQTYRETWDRAQAQSDALFKARYGERAWLQHHIQARHQSQAQP
jgi:hypothetical protein